MDIVIDLIGSAKRSSSLAYASFFNFLLRYRRASLGPIWIIAKPLVFIFFLSALLVGLSSVPGSVFIPHFVVGYVLWGLISGYLIESPGLFGRYRANILQGDFRFTDLVIMSNSELLLQFLHHIPIILVCCIYFKTISSPSALMALVGFAFLIFNGFTLSVFFGIICLRIKDVGHLLATVTQMSFFATPIIWMPKVNEAGVVAKNSVFQAYMDFNPFYHFLELIRAPLLGNPVQQLSYIVVVCISVVSFLMAAFAYKHYRNSVVFWL